MPRVPPERLRRTALEARAQDLARELWDLRRERTAHLNAAADDEVTLGDVRALRAERWARFDTLRSRYDDTLGLKRNDTPPAACVAALTDALGAARGRVETAKANLDAIAAAIADHTGVQLRDAARVAQSVPSTMTAGRSYPVHVRMRNTGSETWTPAAAYRLGSQNPQDNMNWGLGRIDVPGPVAPRQEVDFHFSVTAPAWPGALSYTVNWQWRMLQEAVAWFGSSTHNVGVRVQRPVSALATGRLPDGRLQLWAADGPGALFSTVKVTTNPNAAWSPWNPFFALGAGARRLAVAPLSDGRLELWATDGNGGLATAWMLTTASTSPWSGFNDFYAELGWLPGGARAVAVAPLSDRRLELWASTGDGGLFTTWKTARHANAAWAPWADFYADVGGLPGGAHGLAVAPLRDGRLELWAIAGTGELFVTWKTTTNPNSAWAPWASVFAESGWLPGGARELAVAPLSDGRLQLWAVAGNGGLYSTWQTTTDPNSAWTGWHDFFSESGGLPGGARAVTVGRLSDLRLELWATDAFGGLHTSWQTAVSPNSPWTPWAEHVG